MSAFDARLTAVLADPLAALAGARAPLGYFGPEMPEELLAASGRPWCHLPWRADRPTPHADAWLESSFPGAARSVVEDWTAGRFDAFEAVIFTRADDSSQRVYYYLSELQRRGEIGGPELLILDVAKIARPTSLDHCRRGLHTLADRLDVTDADLAAGIARTNARRRWFAALQDERAGDGAAYDRIASASLVAPVEDWTEAFTPAAAEASGRLLLAGSAPPDARLHDMVEAAGWSVVAELYDRSLLRLGPALAVDGDPFDALARRMHDSPFGARGFVDRAARLVAEARRARADAVLIWLVKEEEALVWQVPAELAALAAAGVPARALSGRRWDGADGIEADIQAFLEEMAR